MTTVTMTGTNSPPVSLSVASAEPSFEPVKR
jgi:hypothetical protein